MLLTGSTVQKEQLLDISEVIANQLINPPDSKQRLRTRSQSQSLFGLIILLD